MKVIHVDDVPIERMQKRDGWAISEFRIPISGADGSATTVFHAVFRAGSTHAKHIHRDCDELVAYLGGRGVVGQSESRAEVTPGHRRLVPRGTEHFFHNESRDQEALVLGFYMGAGSVESTGYEYRGPVEESDVKRPFRGLSEGTFVHLEDEMTTDMAAFDSWKQAEVRLAVGSHTGSENALVDAELAPGAKIARHRLERCEQLYFVASGNGVAVSREAGTLVRKGHVIFVPKATEFGLRNVDTSAPLWIVGVLTGAGSLAEAGLKEA